jgi:hypothetical protein
VAAFETWYAGETDLRGYDPERGWLHAVAHGADLLGVFGRHADVDPARMFTLAVRRLTAPVDYVWRDFEDDRLAVGLIRTLRHEGLDAGTATAWLADLQAACEAEGPNPPPIPAWLSNTMRTMRVLLLAVTSGVRTEVDAPPAPLPHADEVRAALLPIIQLTTPFLA